MLAWRRGAPDPHHKIKNAGLPTTSATCISCVTTIIVPSSASERMTSSTSPTSSGSSAEVGSSNSVSARFIANARVIAARRCWPPESPAGRFMAWSETLTRASCSAARARAPRSLAPRHAVWADLEIIEHGQMRKQVEAPEGCADAPPLAGGGRGPHSGARPARRWSPVPTTLCSDCHTDCGATPRYLYCCSTASGGKLLSSRAWKTLIVRSLMSPYRSKLIVPCRVSTLAV